MILVLTVSLGILYPLAVWGVGQVAVSASGERFADRERTVKVVGSELIGQTFTSPGIFILGRRPPEMDTMRELRAART